MIEQDNLWQDSEFESNQQLVSAKKLKEHEKGPVFEFGRNIKHSNSPFLISEIKGEAYRLNPIRVGEAISFIYDPKRHKSRRRNPNYENEITAFSTIPLGLYTMLRTDSTITTGNVYERLLADFGKDGLGYVVPARAYLYSVEKMGNEVEGLSNSPFAISVDYRILKKKFKLKGERYNQQFFVTGRFDELRESDENNTILRVRKETGKPTTLDAIQLGLDELAYQAISPKEGLFEKELKMQLVNLANGKKYEFGVKDSRFYIELIDALVFSNLSERGGFVPLDEEDIKFGSDMPPEKDEQRDIIYETFSGSKTTISAEIAHERARNCLRRMAGQMQKIDKMYDFKPIHY